MSAVTSPATRPDFAEVEIRLADLNITVDRWTSYEYHSDFMTPTDAWRFTLGDDRISDDLIEQIQPGQRVRFTIGGYVQGDGFINSVNVEASRQGTHLTIAGYDRLGPAVAACVDPRLRFKANHSLLDLLITLFSGFGWSNVDQFEVSNEVNRNVITGQKTGVPFSKGGKRKPPKPLKSYTNHQLQPYPHEGVYEFAERVAQRFGLHIWLSAEGNILIVGKPDFDQEASYSVRNKKGNAGLRNNVLESSVKRDMRDQPTVIVATGRGGGGNFEHTTLMVIMVNEIVGIELDGTLRPEVQDVIKRYPGAKVLPIRGTIPQSRWFPSQSQRPMFLHDAESATLEQLEFFVRRKMAEHQQRAFTATYTFEGHELDDVPFCVDTIAAVDDDFANVHGNLWLKSRRFTGDRHSGKRTTVEMILPHTLEIGGED